MTLSVTPFQEEFTQISRMRKIESMTRTDLLWRVTEVTREAVPAPVEKEGTGGVYALRTQSGRKYVHHNSLDRWAVDGTDSALGLTTCPSCRQRRDVQTAGGGGFRASRDPE